jgi:DNA-binding response OmpR family regulator
MGAGCVKVLILAGDQQIVNNISFCLRVRYPEVRVFDAGDEKRAVKVAGEEEPDLIFIDSSLKGLDVTIPISHIREVSEAPLIVLSDNETDMDRARGLEAGADQYASRSVSPIELLARCKALLRRTGGRGFNVAKTVSIDQLTVNLTTHEVFLSGQPVKVTPIEFGLLSELAVNEGRVVATRDLLDKVWGPEYTRESNMVKTYMYRLRSKLKSADASYHRILNERGFGYKLVRGQK